MKYNISRPAWTGDDDGTKPNKQRQAGIEANPMLAAAYRRRRDFGWMLVIIGNVFGFLETQYFGWNLTPGSKAEFVCDGIAMCITIYGIYILITAKRGLSKG